MAWALLVVAILSEVTGTLALRVASVGGRGWFLLVIVAYTVSFSCLALALRVGMPLGVAYGIWAASGVALTAVASRVLFREPLTPLMVAGIALIGAGVLLVELGAH